MTLAEYFSTGPARERPIFEAVHAHLSALGPVVVEPVSVGILFKRQRTIIELRPKRDWVALSIMLPRVVEHPRIARRLRGTRRLTCHVVNLRRPADVDDVVRSWLTESYLADVPSNRVPPPR
jgi:hypothetical protein